MLRICNPQKPVRLWRGAPLVRPQLPGPDFLRASEPVSCWPHTRIQHVLPRGFSPHTPLQVVCHPPARSTASALQYAASLQPHRFRPTVAATPILWLRSRCQRRMQVIGTATAKELRRAESRPSNAWTSLNAQTTFAHRVWLRRSLPTRVPAP